MRNLSKRDQSARLSYLLLPASTPGVHKLVLRELLIPRQWKPPEDRKFTLDAEQINELCETAERILREEPSVLRLTGALLREVCSMVVCSAEILWLSLRKRGNQTMFVASSSAKIAIVSANCPC